MLFKNARIFTNGAFLRGSFRTENGRFTEILSSVPNEEGLDLGGAKVIPGLVELHAHGNSGADFSDGDYDGLVKMARYLAANGITSFAPASVTSPYDDLRRAYRTAVQLRDEQPVSCARIVGIHMEGPFLAASRKGAQNGEHLRAPDINALKELIEAADGLLRIADVAPELPGAMDFIEEASKLLRVSVAHTDADYETAKEAFARGARHLTHLYNCMPSIHHRAPGTICAAFDRDDVTAELICDGFHVHPSTVRVAFRLFPGRICLVSDALRCCGMPDGDYTLGGLPVVLAGGVARLKDGTVAGSAAHLFTCLKNAVAFGIPEAEAIEAATLNPAKALGADAEIGSIAPGKRADFVVCTEDLSPQKVYLNGAPL